MCTREKVNSYGFVIDTLLVQCLQSTYQAESAVAVICRLNLTDGVSRRVNHIRVTLVSTVPASWRDVELFE